MFDLEILGSEGERNERFTLILAESAKHTWFRSMAARSDAFKPSMTQIFYLSISIMKLIEDRPP